MLGYIIIIMCILLGLFSIYKYKDLFNPVFCFCFIFSFCTWLSTMEINGVALPESRTYMMIGLGVLFFWLGGMTSDNKFRIKRREYICYIDYKRLKFVSVVGIISSFIELRNTIVVFLTGGIREIYNQRLAMLFDGAENMMSKNYFEAFISQFVFQPVMHFLMPMYLYLYFKDRKKKYFVYSVLILLGLLLSSGGRTIVIVYAIYYLLLFAKYGVHTTSFLRISKANIKYYFGGCIGFLILCYTFIQRNTNVFKTIGAYFGYPITHMQEKIQLALPYQYTFGLTSLQGLFRPILNIVEKIFNTNVVLLENAGQVSNIANKSMSLAPGVSYNAFVTPFYYFFIDFGWFGIILLSFVFGWFSNKRYLKWIKIGDARTTLVFLLSFALPICFSFVRMQYALGSVPWAMILTMFVCSKKQVKDSL